jgi:hypothetical protein
MSLERSTSTSWQLEPYLDQAVPVTEAAILVSGRPLETPCTETNFGWVKLLSESRVQFDIVDHGCGNATRCWYCRMNWP